LGQFATPAEPGPKQVLGLIR